MTTAQMYVAPFFFIFFGMALSVLILKVIGPKRVKWLLEKLDIEIG